MTTPAFTIRPAVDADVRSIAEFQTACWREAYRGMVPQDYLDRVSVEDRELRWRDRLRTGAREIALATSDNALIGVVSWGGAPVELMSLYVAAQHRGAGVADVLLGRAIGAAYLWVFEPNARAVTFYARHGFAPSGHRAPDPDTGVTMIRLARR